MKFGPVALAAARGAILAHSVRSGGYRLRKGTVLQADHLEALAAAGFTRIVVARLEADDLGEDVAADLLGAALAGGMAHVSTSAAFAGRVNLFATKAGVMSVDTDALLAVNAVDEAIAVATLPHFARVAQKSMIATLKIIPYGVAATAVHHAADLLCGVLAIHPRVIGRAALIRTTTPGMKSSVLQKGRDAVMARLQALGVTLDHDLVVAHDRDAIAGAIRTADTDLVLILGASATSDRRDVAPAGLVAAGGQVDRFGIPVDPGNLLFLGRIGERHVVGLPGCVRAPVLNGADWVLERLISGLKVTDRDVAAMGAGGLLKESPLRPHPRRAQAPAASAPKVDVLLLAAGSSTRMRGADKLMQEVEGTPLLRRLAVEMTNSGADDVLVVLPAEAPSRHGALSDLPVQKVTAHRATDGMSASLAAGIAALSEHCDAVVIALADMPEVTAHHVDQLIAAYSPGDGREICRAVTADGAPGHPVLFGRRFFENLALMQGDRGARDLLRQAVDFVVDVPTAGDTATVDLDTPEDWANWRSRRQEV
jgi:molybdenum cofactor cytidylyltransferase